MDATTEMNADALREELQALAAEAGAPTLKSAISVLRTGAKPTDRRSLVRHLPRPSDEVIRTELEESHREYLAGEYLPVEEVLAKLRARPR